VNSPVEANCNLLSLLSYFYSKTIQICALFRVYTVRGCKASIFSTRILMLLLNIITSAKVCQMYCNSLVCLSVCLTALVH